MLPTDTSAAALVRPSALYSAELRRLSDRLVNLARPLAVLRAVRWGDEVQRRFFADGGRLPPPISAATYGRPLPFDPVRHDRLLAELSAELRRRLGPRQPGAALLLDRCRQARGTVELLRRRGTSAFARLSRRLYLGDEATPALGGLIAWLRRRADAARPSPDEEAFDAEAAAAILRRRLAARFREDPIRVSVSPGLLADAAAEGGALKLRAGARFAESQLRLLEVHEGCVHVGTTRHGRAQAVCTFLAQAFPSTTPTQEGLAVLAELAAGVCHPSRLRQLACRLEAGARAAAGADFLDVYRLLLDRGLSPVEGYHQAARVFRGSLPVGAGPFAKDLAYGVGLLRVAAWLDAGRDAGSVQLLWCGKSALADVDDLARLAAEGLLREPVVEPVAADDLRRAAAEVRRLG